MSQEVYLYKSAVRKFCRAHGKILTQEVFDLLNSNIQKKLRALVTTHDGGRKKLSVQACGILGITPDFRHD